MLIKNKHNHRIYMNLIFFGSKKALIYSSIFIKGFQFHCRLKLHFIINMYHLGFRAFEQIYEIWMFYNIDGTKKIMLKRHSSYVHCKSFTRSDLLT